MNNIFTHIVFVPMTGVGIRPFRGQEWYKYRIELFKQYTLRSLLNQTNRRFVLWLGFRPEERDNPLTKELEQYLKEKGIFTVMTFTGLPYHDDKFNSGWKEKLMNLARIVRMAYQDNSPQEVRTLGAFVKMVLTNKFPFRFGWRQALKELFTNKNETLKDRLAIALGELQRILDKPDLNWVYVTRIDSDDMLHRDAIAEIQKFPPFPGALTMRNGYVYDSNQDKLAEWKPATNPPFHTIIFPKQNFFEPARYLQYFRGFKSHEDVPTVFNSQNLKDGLYCVLVHKKHISTVYEHPWKGKEVDKEILKGFLEAGFFEMDGHKFALPFDDNQACREIVNDYLAHINQGRIWETETTKLIKETVKEGDVCVDVGASIGYFTMLLARQSKRQVIAVEPTFNQCRYIEKNTNLNGYDVLLFNNAAWDKQETIHTPIHTNALPEKPMLGVPLDDILPERVDFIKMDIDGSEPRALRGLVKTFERNPQLKMVCEFYPKCIEELGNKPQDMLDILSKYFDYKKIEGDYNSEYYNLICTRKSNQ